MLFQIFFFFFNPNNSIWTHMAISIEPINTLNVYTKFKNWVGRYRDMKFQKTSGLYRFNIKLLLFTFFAITFARYLEKNVYLFMLSKQIKLLSDYLQKIDR